MALVKRQRKIREEPREQPIKVISLTIKSPSILHVELATKPSTSATQFWRCWSHHTNQRHRLSLTALTSPDPWPSARCGGVFMYVSVVDSRSKMYIFSRLPHSYSYPYLQMLLEEPRIKATVRPLSMHVRHTVTFSISLQIFLDWFMYCWSSLCFQ